MSDRHRVRTQWYMRHKDGTWWRLMHPKTCEINMKLLKDALSEHRQGQLERPPKIEQSRLTPKRILWTLLKGTALVIIKNMWRPFALDIETSTFDLVANSLHTYWGFIFSMREILLPDWPLDSNWKMQNFIFGAEHTWPETMGAILKNYEERFGGRVELATGKEWLHEIIYKSRTKLESLQFSLPVFHAFEALALFKIGSRIADYLLFLRQNNHEAHIGYWYLHGGKEDGTASIAELKRLLESRWADNVRDSQLYEHVVKAGCALYMSRKSGLEVSEESFNIYASCVALLRARFNLSRPQKKFAFEQLRVISLSLSQRQ